jgi:hypothetical protein
VRRSGSPASLVDRGAVSDNVQRLPTRRVARVVVGHVPLYGDLRVYAPERLDAPCTPEQTAHELDRALP